MGRSLYERSGSLSLDESIEQVVARGPVLLGVDFDGTLAPLVDHPDLAVPDARGIEILTSLANRDDVEVAIVSGRSVGDLRERLGDLPDVTLIGEHGNDFGEPPEANHGLHDASSFVARLQEQWPDATVERKQRSVTFHTRGLGRNARHSARRAIEEWARGRRGITLLEGKEVFELSTATRTKGDAIRELAAGRAVVYLGDDTTDETVFETLGPADIGVKVGEGPTSARFRVGDVDGVVSILETIDRSSR